jgi:dTDP-4-dehydrorhamnose 3,5-epimerase
MAPILPRFSIQTDTLPTPLDIPEVLLIKPRRFADSRGWFSETFSLAEMEALGLPRFIQDNESLSVNAGTVRGLHFQKGPHEQAKLVRCVRGALLDVALDIRPGSPTFGRHVSTRLTPESGEQLFIPVGFAHGFCTLAPNTVIQYKVSSPYAPGNEGGILWNDPALGIGWPVAPGRASVSDRDSRLPLLAEAGL